MSNINVTSYRDADVGETFEDAPRINSSHLRRTYSAILQLADVINFNSPIFNDMLKRNRSLGSVQAFVMEQALSWDVFVDERIKPFCVGKGINLMLGSHYMDNVYFERLAAYEAKKKNASIVPPPSTVSQTRRQHWS